MEKITYKKSFSAKLTMERETIPFYQDIKDLCSTRKNVSTRLSFNKETINFAKNKVGLLKIARKNLCLYLNLNPSRYLAKYKSIKDVSDTKLGMDYPMMLVIKGPRILKQALALLDIALNKVNAKDFCQALNVNYANVFYPRSFEELLEAGLIKKYVRKMVDGKMALVLDEASIKNYKVNFTAKLLYEAAYQADELFIVTNFTNWDENKAYKMNKISDNLFTATMSFPKDTALEFKICRSQNFNDVEKGIWKEEIVNHHYVVVDQDLEIEDLIHNFRQN